MISNNTNESGLAEDGVTNESHIVFVTSFIIEASAIILINLLTIITFAINRHLRKRSMYCLSNLAVADMVFGIGVLVYLTLWKMHRIELLLSTYHFDQSSAWQYGLLAVLSTGTMFSLALVAVERMCATVWALRHRNGRPWAYTLAFSMTWTASAMNGLLIAIIMTAFPDIAITFYRTSSFYFGLGVVLVIGIICVSYIVIFIKVKKQQQQMAGQRLSLRDQRLAMTLFIVTVASFGSWIPIALVSLLAASDVIVAPYYVYGALNGLAFSNSFINPIIYVLRMKDFKKALLHLILTCSRDRPTLVVPQPN